MHSKIASGFAWSYAERITAQLVSFIVSIVLARLITPDEYGTVSMVLIIINICNVFVTSGFGSGLIQKQDTTEEDFSTVFWFSLAIGIILYILIYLMSPAIARFFDYDDLVSVLCVMALRIPLASINSIQHAYVSRKMIFKKFFWSTLFGTIVSAVIGIIMAIMGFGVWALVCQYLSNTLIDTIVLFITVKWHPRLIMQLSRLAYYYSYGWKILAAALLDSIYTNLRSFIIGKKYTGADLAYYNKGMQMPALVVNNINSSIIRVMFPAFSREQESKENLHKMVKRAISTSAFVLSPLLVGLFVIGRPLIIFLLTDKWTDAILYLRIFCVSYLFMPIHAINQEAIKATGRSDISLKVEIIKKVFGVALIVVCIVMKDSALSLAVSFLLYTLVALIINGYPGKKLYDYSWIEQLIDVGKPLLMSCVMAVTIYPLQLAIQSNILLIISQVLCGAIVYICIALAIKNEIMMSVVVRLKKKYKREV